MVQLINVCFNKSNWQNAATVFLQSGFRLSLTRAAFSRSSKPFKPTSWESARLISGWADLIISATLTSCYLEAGEKTPTMTAFLIPEEQNKINRVKPLKYWNKHNNDKKRISIKSHVHELIHSIILQTCICDSSNSEIQ